MNWKRLGSVAVLVAGVLWALCLLDRRGREYERLQHSTDSLNVRVEQYQADSARRQAAIDNALDAAAWAETLATRAGLSAEEAGRQRDSLVDVIRADTGDVPRASFEAVVSADSAVILSQRNQIAGLKAALSHVYVAFHEADSARVAADSLLREMTENRDRWRIEAKRGNRIGLVTSFAWTIPSGQWQATIGVGKRIRLPGFLGGL